MIFYDFPGQISDVVVINGKEKILAHSLVFMARCKKIYDEIITANGTKYLEIWSHLRINVVKSFLSYLYSGIVDVKLITHEDHESAKFFCQNYPNLENWKLYMENCLGQTQ